MPESTVTAIKPNTQIGRIGARPSRLIAHQFAAAVGAAWPSPLSGSSMISTAGSPSSAVARGILGQVQ